MKRTSFFSPYYTANYCVSTIIENGIGVPKISKDALLDSVIVAHYMIVDLSRIFFPGAHISATRYVVIRTAKPQETFRHVRCTRGEIPPKNGYHTEDRAFRRWSMRYYLSIVCGFPPRLHRGNVLSFVMFTRGSATKKHRCRVFVTNTSIAPAMIFPWDLLRVAI